MPTPRTFLSTAAIDGKIYAIGGVVAGDPGAFPYPPVMEEYDPATDTWTKKADMPTARSMASASVVDGKIYVIGGVIGGVGNSSSPIVEEYDPKTDTWTKKANMPTGGKALSTSVVNGKIYAIGGGIGMTTIFSTVEVYDPATDTWARKVDMPTAKCLHSTSAVNGSVYSIGGSVVGWPWTATPKVEVYDTGFVPLPDARPVSPRGKLPAMWGKIKQ
jgi:N-acetylneuraminic acid mutarotase